MSTEEVTKGTVACSVCGKPLRPSTMQKHMKAVHPEQYVPKSPGRKSKNAVNPLPVDDLIAVVTSALYDDGKIPVRHLGPILKLRDDLTCFMKAVSS